MDLIIALIIFPNLYKRTNKLNAAGGAEKANQGVYCDIEYNNACDTWATKSQIFIRLCFRQVPKYLGRSN